MVNLFEKADVTGIISHDFIYPMQFIDPSIIHVLFFKYIEFYRSSNPNADIIWISSSFPNLQFIDAIKYLEKMGEVPKYLDEITFYKLPEFSDILSHQRQKVETLIDELEKIRSANRKTLLVIDDMDMMIKSNTRGSIAIDQVFTMLFHTLKKSKISIVYHSPAVSSAFVTQTGDRKILPRWIHSITMTKPKQVKLVFHWVIRPTKDAQVKTEERHGRYTIIRYNSIPKKKRIDIDEEDLVITDLAEGLKQVFVPAKSKRIKQHLPELILSSPEYQTSKYVIDEPDIDLKLFKTPRIDKQQVIKHRSRTPRLSNSLWIMKYTCALKSVQKEKDVIQFYEMIKEIRSHDFDREYKSKHLHDLQLLYMKVLGLGASERDTILEYFDLNSSYLGQDWLIAFIATFVFWWKHKRSWEIIDRDQLIELTSSVLSNQIINSWIRGSIIYDGKKVAALARKLSNSVSLIDPLFNHNMDRVSRFIESRPEGSFEIITHTMEDTYVIIGKIIILNIPGFASYTLFCRMDTESELLDEFNSSLDTISSEKLYEDIMEHKDTRIRHVNFVVIDLKNEYKEDTLKMEFTELVILFDNTIYNIKREASRFSWKRLDRYEIF